MKPAPFEYHRPDSVDEALALLAEHGYDAKLLAGGQSLVPAMNFRLAQPAVLIDLNQVAELQYESDDDGVMRIGAMERQRYVEWTGIAGRLAPLLAEALPFVAHAQIRNRGTIGGSIAHADPAGEIGAVMLALEARFHLRGPGGARVVPAAEFFTGLFGTALEADEMLTEVEIPAAAPRTGWAFDEVSRRHGDYALAGLAAAVEVGADGRCTAARLAFLGVADAPMLAHEAAAALLGQAPTEDAIRAAADAAAQRDIDPPGDIHASPTYRRHLAGVLVRRVLPRAFARAGAA
ncbi:MAG TPA: xanthine dehydrogenase family protein subunit M [Longimicrobium sp.]|nr:xanthine dehydrogenase family protein subunit M [Longimicrobium sp.]